MNNRKQLFIIDDDADHCELLSEIAKIVGLTPVVSANLTLADTLAAHAPDVIVLDLVMPDMDGVEVLSMLAKRGCAAFIILVSGHDEKMLKVAAKFATALKLNVIGHMTKPIDLERMEAMLASAAQATA